MSWTTSAPESGHYWIRDRERRRISVIECDGGDDGRVYFIDSEHGCSWKKAVEEGYERWSDPLKEPPASEGYFRCSDPIDMPPEIQR